MYDPDFSDDFLKTLSKLFNKDRVRYEIVLKKIDEILSSPNVQHDKNLRAPMQRFKRVHIDSSFVLLFKVFENEHLISFESLEHHDDVY